MSGNGGKRIGAGRPKGAVNKACADLKAVASVYTQEALDVLVAIARSGQSEAARVAAANSILDRAHGRPTQTINANITSNPNDLTDDELADIVRAGGGNLVVSSGGAAKPH